MPLASRAALWVHFGNEEGMEVHSKPPILSLPASCFPALFIKALAMGGEEYRVAMVSSPEFSLDCIGGLGLHVEGI